MLSDRIMHNFCKPQVVAQICGFLRQTRTPLSRWTLLSPLGCKSNVQPLQPVLNYHTNPALVGNTITHKHGVNSAGVYINTRTFYRMLNNVFNRPDRNRIKEVGPDRACAEWLLRCGAHVRWKDGKKFQTDYNALPPGNYKSFFIEEIDASDAAVMDIGFEHFSGVKHIKKIRFHHCIYLDDNGIAQLGRIKDSLEHLEICDCGDISEEGLATLDSLCNLKTLILRELTGVRNKSDIYRMLQAALPGCDVQYPDVTREVEKT